MKYQPMKRYSQYAYAGCEPDSDPEEIVEVINMALAALKVPVKILWPETEDDFLSMVVTTDKHANTLSATRYVDALRLADKYKAQWKKDYDFDLDAFLDADRYCKQLFEDCDNATELAEAVALTMDHAEWLDEESHPLWEMVLDYYPND